MDSGQQEEQKPVKMEFIEDYSESDPDEEPLRVKLEETEEQTDVTDAVKSVSVNEGDSVTLNTDVTETQQYLMIQWTFGSTRIAEFNRLTQTSSKYDERFRDRLTLDQTGSLTITNITTSDSGFYQLTLVSGETKYKGFNVTVNERPSSSNCVTSSFMVNDSNVNQTEDDNITELYQPNSGVSAEMVTVMEGDSVTLHTNLSEIQNDDTILWLFGPKDSLISQITRKGDFNTIYFTDDERFRHRLQVDQNTGSLTVRNIRIRHSGQYKLSISREINTIKIFHVTVLGVANRTDEVKSISVKEGKSVSLNINTDIRPDDLILWRFGDQGILLAKIDVETNETSLNDDDERFRDRLKIDHQTGTLIIKNTRTEHAGLYELQIRGSESSHRFLLSVNAGAALALSAGGIVGITFAVLLVLVVIVIYFRWKISKLQEQVVSENNKVEEGGSLCLPTGVPELQKDNRIQWYYKDEQKDILIAEINKETATYNNTDKRFKNKLTLNPQTGDLTINNIKILHAGLYRLTFKRKMRTKHNRFMVMVTANTKLEAKGDVPLKTGADIKQGDLILWTFGLKNCLVATVESSTSYIVERFKDKLELDPQTGSLTIKNISNTEYGHYKLQIINEEQTTFRRFIVLEPAEPKSEAKGNNVLLKTGVTTIKPGDLILWMFGAKNWFIARADSNKTAISERFKDRVQLDPQTGSLTIRNITNREYGHYKVQIINEEKTTFRRFNVFDPDPGNQGDENTALMSRNNDILMLQDIS